MNNRLYRAFAGQIASEAMTKAFSQVQDVISKVFHKDEMHVESISYYELIMRVVNDQELWREYCIALRKNSVITNLAAKEYLLIFIKENREYIENQYNILKTSNNDSAVSTIEEYADGYFGGARNLCNMIMQNCKDEIDNYTHKKQVTSQTKQANEKSSDKQESAPGKIRKNILLDSKMQSKKKVCDKRVNLQRLLKKTTHYK